MTAIKPPLGLVPRYLRNAHRLQEIDAAITRYVEHLMPIPQEWLDERALMNGEVFAVTIQAKFPEIDTAFEDFLREALEGGGEIKVVSPLRKLDGTWTTNGSYTFVPTIIKEIP